MRGELEVQEGSGWSEGENGAVAQDEHPAFAAAVREGTVEGWEKAIRAAMDEHEQSLMLGYVGRGDEGLIEEAWQHVERHEAGSSDKEEMRNLVGGLVGHRLGHERGVRIIEQGPATNEGARKWMELGRSAYERDVARSGARDTEDTGWAMAECGIGETRVEMDRDVAGQWKAGGTTAVNEEEGERVELGQTRDEGMRRLVDTAKVNAVRVIARTIQPGSAASEATVWFRRMSGSGATGAPKVGITVEARGTRV